MEPDKVVITEQEVRHAVVSHGEDGAPARVLPPAIPWWARILLSVLVLALPLLCAVGIVIRIALRHQPTRDRLAWSGFLSSLLIASGLWTTMLVGLLMAFVPLPVIVNASLPELDERTSFPALPSTALLDSPQISTQLKPLVVVISPAAARLWSHQETPSSMLGAGMLLYAGQDGYLFATAKHVATANGSWTNPEPHHALLATSTSGWGTGQVVALGKDLDLALLWIPRTSGHGSFAQPLAAPEDGSSVFVIGHPEGLRFTLSTGIISSVRGNVLQLSAPVSPGNSGGPVYDAHGSLVGIVSAKFDRSHDPNAENLSFAIQARNLLKDEEWQYFSNGKALLDQYRNALQSQPATAVPHS